MEMDESKAVNQFNISRIDKNFMSPEGINDLSNQFGDYTPLVIEIITFFGLKFKYNFFNMFATTVDEFSKITGIDKSTLNRAAPLPADMKKYPVYDGHEFKSYFDYTIYLMFSRNWVFSKPVHSNYGATHIKAIQILEEVFVKRKGTSEKSAKHYTFRLNEKFLEAMQNQFWPVDVHQKKMLGQFKKAKNARTLFIALSGYRHSAVSQNTNYVIVPLNDLAKAALIKENQEPKHVKQSIIRMLEKIKTDSGFKFTYEFISQRKHQEDYWVKMEFYGSTLEAREEIVFNLELHSILEKIFRTRKTPEGVFFKDVKISNEKNNYQRWLDNPKFDLNEKAFAVQKAYTQAYKITLPLKDCLNYVTHGFHKLLESINKNNIHEIK